MLKKFFVLFFSFVCLFFRVYSETVHDTNLKYVVIFS